jgi:hypothetical protein
VALTSRVHMFMQAKIAQLAERACQAAKASDKLSDSDAVLAAEVRMEANWMQTRANLTMGDDAKAAKIAEEVTS